MCCVRSRGSLGDLGLLILPWLLYISSFSTVYNHFGEVSLSFLARSNTVIGGMYSGKIQTSQLIWPSSLGFTGGCHSNTCMELSLWRGYYVSQVSAGRTKGLVGKIKFYDQSFTIEFRSEQLHHSSQFIPILASVEIMDTNVVGTNCHCNVFCL